jgi:hypothetical protein
LGFFRSVPCGKRICNRTALMLEIRPVTRGDPMPDRALIPVNNLQHNKVLAPSPRDPQTSLLAPTEQYFRTQVGGAGGRDRRRQGARPRLLRDLLHLALRAARCAESRRGDRRVRVTAEHVHEYTVAILPWSRGIWYERRCHARAEIAPGLPNDANHDATDL